LVCIISALQIGSRAGSTIVQNFLPGLPNTALRFGAGQPMLRPILGGKRCCTNQA
jgi:hypothetical protein